MKNLIFLFIIKLTFIKNLCSLSSNSLLSCRPVECYNFYYIIVIYLVVPYNHFIIIEAYIRITKKKGMLKKCIISRMHVQEMNTQRLNKTFSSSQLRNFKFSCGKGKYYRSEERRVGKEGRGWRRGEE